MKKQFEHFMKELPKPYAHFDNRIAPKKIWNYITNSENVKKHSFYPFIYRKIVFKKFSKAKGKSAQFKQKTRDIYYASHIDRCIYKYYGIKLNTLYENKVNELELNNCSIAYRSCLGKCNIHFAKKAFEFISKQQGCNILIGDFTNFFDNLDHKYLKEMIKKVLEVDQLPSDYYAIFKNITKFSSWNFSSLMELNNLNSKKISSVSKLNSKRVVLQKNTYKKHKKNHIKKNSENFGIPQGSPISAVLSNIYMLEFDQQVSQYVKKYDGLYMRYSDDFIIVIPNSKDKTFDMHFECIDNYIKNVPNLELQPKKTQKYSYNYNFFIDLDLCKKSKIDYLGFTFDGSKIGFRDKTIHKYYYKLYRKLKTIVKNKGWTKNKNRINSKELYNKYTIKGANINRGNFITYARKAKKIFNSEKFDDFVLKNHMFKIRRQLKKIT